MDVEATAQLPESFSHAADSHPRDAGRGHLTLFFWRYTLAAILDLDANVTVRGNNANRGGQAFRMTMDIGETFLDGPENGRLRFAGKPPKILRKFQIDFNLTALRES